MAQSEPDVRIAVVRWLTGKQQKSKWEIRSTAETGTHGADIVAERNGHYFIIEAKGDANPSTVKAENRSVNRTVKFQLAVAQLISRMKREQAAQYGLALPESYRQLASRGIPWVAARKLKLRILLVEPSGKVNVLNARDLRNLQRVVR